MRNKRGQGHVEFLISFVLFTSAIFLLFYFINPLKNSQPDVKIQENAKEMIINNISDEIGELIIVVNKEVNPLENPCYKLDLDDYENQKFTEIDETPATENNKNIYHLYFSKYSNDIHPSYDSGCGEDFSIGVYSKENYVIAQKILELKVDYENNYNELKKSLGLKNDFAFSFKYLDGAVESRYGAEKFSSKNVEKYSTEFPIRVIDETGKISQMIINIKLW